MSRRRAIEERVKVYRELCDIMGAMRNIALMEMRKAAGVMVPQRALRETLERAAGDLFGLPSIPRLSGTAEPTLIVAIGSERGFCGNFNASIQRRLDELLAKSTSRPKLIVVGRRLAQQIAATPDDGLAIEGATIMEEVEPTLKRLLDAVSANRLLREAFTLEGLAIVHSTLDDEREEARVYRPVERFLGSRKKAAIPVRVQLPPRQVLAGLVEHYLTETLLGSFYSSLAVENRLRFAHMESAVNRMNARIADLRSLSNRVRQEEITEDIEEIILGAGDLLQTVRSGT